MDSNISSIMQSYNESEDDFDMAAFMQDENEMMNELLLKRSQVQQLRKDLDAADTKIFELSRKLDDSNRVNTDAEYMSKRMRNLEDKLQELKHTDTTSDANLVCENKILRDKLEKAHMENKSLLRQIDDLNIQHQNDIFYRKELLKEDSKIQSVIGKCTETVEKLEDDSTFLEALNAIDLCEKQQHTIEFYKNKSKLLEKENQSLEGELIHCKAKLDTLKYLMESYSLDQKRPSFFYNQTFNTTESLRKEIVEQHDQIQAFREKLKAEIDANVQLIERDATNVLQIEDFKQKLAAFSKTEAT